jgi:hypothetical protein
MGRVRELMGGQHYVSIRAVVARGDSSGGHQVMRRPTRLAPPGPPSRNLHDQRNSPTPTARPAPRPVRATRLAVRIVGWKSTARADGGPV